MIVDYILNKKKQATLIDCQGVLFNDNSTIAKSFIAQSRLNPRVDNNGRTFSDRNDRYRSERICKELTRKYGLYFANGKEQVKTHRLKEPDKTRYEIYQVLKREVARCSDWTTLLKRLKAEGIDVRFKYKGNTNEVQGIIFTKNG